MFDLWLCSPNIEDSLDIFISPLLYHHHLLHLLLVLHLHIRLHPLLPAGLAAHLHRQREPESILYSQIFNIRLILPAYPPSSSTPPRRRQEERKRTKG